ncbi:MAG: hypothetical protein AB7G93_03705 [Bdellovibrionales bacterium]
MALLFLAFGSTGWASFSGQLKSSTDFYPIHLGDATDDLVPYLVLDLSGKHRFSKTFRFQAKGLALTNFESDTSPEKAYADLQEGFFELKLDSLKLRAGMNTFNWGVVDLSSPSDVVNSSTLFHPLRTFKRGAPTVEAEWQQDWLGLHLIYIPRQVPSKLPSLDSRWLPREILLNIQSQEGRIILPSLLEYQYGPAITLDHALDHNFGARVSSHLGSVDLYLSHFDGAAPSPKLYPTVLELDFGGTSDEFIARSPITLSAINYRTRTSGLGLVWARESWIYRLETAYSHTRSDDPALQPWSWASVLAVETGLNVGTRTVMLLGQYYHTENPQDPDNLISSSYRLFDRTVVLGARWPATDDLTFTTSALIETQSQGLFWMLSFESKLTDSLKWGAGWRDFSAREEGLIKTFERNDHATMDLIYYF